MAHVRLNNLSKSYGKVDVIKDVSLDIKDGEFVVLIGPSGCGKSTLLRMIAGLESITSGTLQIGGAPMNDVPPRDRGISMVFQSYALYPHMNSADNMSFSLKLAGEDEPQRRSKVDRAADILGLGPYLDRLPKQLSGGQRQRVAMGRAIVRKPEVFLFDEPLSNLDAKLRVKMRAELKELHQKLKTTTIYVTHDQVEAMTLADRIVVLRDGEIEQIGTPLELYDNPANAFVGAFLGSPTMNLLDLEVSAENPSEARFSDGEALRLAAPAAPGRATVGIRPECFALQSEAGSGALRAEVVVVEPTGASTELVVRKAGQNITVLSHERLAINPGDSVWLVPNAERVHAFPDGAAA
ncbi:sn-glycerol-3-phosphate ABC transporter ATP-binding protein UgpC [Marinovum sp. 2_MG-2023]|uniref:ABC transporter ATP-binding protein n=1 Tax=Roseobacteraceae TaxID=2854170 RepID=UPI001FD14E73|nr:MULTISPECIES: sn-glycerol-3-phosphate ABC transporter ATP-binding protein UgpC [Roseobacteraceae]MCJ7873212.1 sn-glycerol-3-phosphate ABC transporter ATP-binding protein UgpC [Phaeobacter sp. J2-8]MDO6729129.1 sn-glycerol-3-phosphate ABC transporter ATP-binding protein UgpC [Marinovum sp. 2_MG-2023]MDO6779244.1 sn-glycerol-3-phosphate ABC transporter ATP-binding protein UgpC [Marinovum sp. 1_MG-2023]